MEIALQRHSEGKTKVIPVIAKPCLWHELPFGKLQAVPKDGKAISRFEDHNEAWVEVASKIKGIVNKLLEKR